MCERHAPSGGIAEAAVTVPALLSKVHSRRTHGALGSLCLQGDHGGSIEPGEVGGEGFLPLTHWQSGT